MIDDTKNKNDTLGDPINHRGDNMERLTFWNFMAMMIVAFIFIFGSLLVYIFGG
jgi:hypothetical protein